MVGVFIVVVGVASRNDSVCMTVPVWMFLLLVADRLMFWVVKRVWILVMCLVVSFLGF